MPTAQSARAAAIASSRVRAWSTTRSPASSTKPAFVENDAPLTGTLIAPGTCPDDVVGERTDVEHRRVARVGELLGLGRQRRATGRGSERRRARSSAAAASTPTR